MIAARWLAVALLLSIAGAGPARGDYRQSYLDGLRAVRRGDWDTAVRRLTEAARERPQEQARARLVGAIPEPYLPHFYLGLAHFNLRRCDDAVGEWSTSEQQGAIQSQPALLTQARRYRAQCEDLTGAREQVGRAEAEAARLAGTTAELAGDGDPDPDPDLARRRDEALADLDDARAQLAAATERWDFAALPAVAERAGAVAERLAALRTQLLERNQERARAALVGGPHPADAAAPATAPPAETPVAAPDPPPPAAPALPAAAAGAETAKAALPAALVAAIQAYFDGDYSSALAALAEADPATGPRASALVRLFGAAARYALFVVGGESDRALLDAAVDDVQALRREAPAFAPHPDHFSPRFIAFFRDHPSP